jgi:hypothetical protein
MIESYAYHDSALYSKNPDWKLKTINKIDVEEIDDTGNLIRKDKKFVKLLEDFLDLELKTIVNAKCSDADREEAFFEDIKVFSSFDDILLSVGFECNNYIRKIYKYDPNTNKILHCITAENVIYILPKTYPYHIKEEHKLLTLNRPLLRLLANSTTCPYIAENFIQNTNNDVIHMNKRVFKLINLVYTENSRNIDKTICELKRLLCEDLNTNERYYNENDDHE